MSQTFKHINADQQIVNGTITTPLFADSSVTIQKININGDLNFNNYQAIALRLENVSTNPAPGNAGRLVWNTTLSGVYVDTGSIFESISSTGAVTAIYSDSNPLLTGTVQFVSGTNIDLDQVGNAITINSSASPIITGDLTEVVSDVLIITGGTDAVVGSGTTLDVKQAGSGQSGYLSSTDWITFNNKQPSGNYITALTGDATASGPGSSALTLTTVNSNVGSFTSANITVDAKGRITAAANGSASSVNYQQDLFDVVDAMNYILTLTFSPILSSETLSWNGVVLRPGVLNDYTVSGNTITLNVGLQLTVGDGFLVTYSY